MENRLSPCRALHGGAKSFIPILLMPFSIPVEQGRGRDRKCMTLPKPFGEGGFVQVTTLAESHEKISPEPSTPVSSHRMGQGAYASSYAVLGFARATIVTNSIAGVQNSLLSLPK